MKQRWFEKAEARWQLLQKEITIPIKEAGTLVRAHPLTYLLFVAGYMFIRLLWATTPLQQFEGTTLYIVAWTASSVEMFLRFGLFLILYAYTLSKLRGTVFELPLRQFVQNYWRALPFGAGLYLLFEQVRGLLWYGLYSPLKSFISENASHFLFTFTLHIAAIPILYILCRFGFPILAASARERLSLLDSWRLTSQSFWALFLTTILWWTLRHLPNELFIHLIPPSTYFNWFSRPYSAFVAIIFGVVSAVWYEKLQLRYEAQQTAITDANYGQCQD